MTDFWIKEDDTSPVLEATLTDENGNAVDLTGASVDFHMRRQLDDTLKVDGTASIIDAANGKVQYSWSSGDTDTTGKYDAEFEVTYSSGDIETFPNHENIVIKITDDLG